MIPSLSTLDTATKLLFAIELQPLQGQRFQPTGFPSLGAATYESKHGANLLVESAQSMANRLETVCWDESADQPRKELAGLSYVRVERQGKYLTSSITEAHRINSPYLLEGSDKTFFNQIKSELAVLLAEYLKAAGNKAVTLLYPADVTVQLHAGRVGNSSFTVSHRLTLRDEPEAACAEGDAVLVWVDLATGKARPLPDHIRQALQG